MRFKLTLLALALVAFAASPAWAGQVNLVSVQTVKTTVQTQTGTFADTLITTDALTNLMTLVDTVADTLAETNLATSLVTNVGTDTGTFASTLLDTRLSSSGTRTIVMTDAGSIGNTALSTAVYTNVDTRVLTITETGLITSVGTLALSAVETNTGSFADTLTETVVETIWYAGQPADVSIEISQEGMNYTSPFGNSMVAASLHNKVSAAGTAGVTQIQANSGAANVSVASNSVLDGTSLVAFADNVDSQVSLKELGVLALVPGFALQNSNAATTAHIAGLALTGAEAARLVVAVDIAQAGINEYSPNGNSVKVGGPALNQVAVKATAGITQVQANAGAGNVSAAHNVLLVNTGARPF